MPERGNLQQSLSSATEQLINQFSRSNLQIFARRELRTFAVVEGSILAGAIAYAATINLTHRDEAKSLIAGSIVGLIPVLVNAARRN